MPGDRRQALLAAHLVDDLQHALAVGAVLHPELVDEAAVVDQVIARDFLAAAVLVKVDLRVGQEFAHHLGDLAEADPTPPVL